jgi:rhodanese-related sulfurtransferase
LTGADIQRQGIMKAMGGMETHAGGVRFVTPREAYPLLLGGAVLVDLRAGYLVGMKAFLVPDILRIPHRELPQRFSELPRDRLLILADTSGVYTRDAAALLHSHGFDRVMCLNGGLLAWDQNGLPLKTDEDALLHGECDCVMKSRKQSTDDILAPDTPRRSR